MPVPGTITPEPEPVELESDAALPSRVDHRDVGRPAGRRRLERGRRVPALDPPQRGPQRRRARAALPASPPRWSRAAEPGPARPPLLAHHLGERRDAPSALPGARRGQARRAARARRRSGRRPTRAAGSRAPRGPRSATPTGPPPDRPGRRRGRRGSARRRRPAPSRRSPGRSSPRAERRGALRGDPLERVGEVGQPEQRRRRRAREPSGPL